MLSTVIAPGLFTPRAREFLEAKPSRHACPFLIFTKTANKASVGLSVATSLFFFESTFFADDGAKKEPSPVDTIQYPPLPCNKRSSTQYKYQTFRQNNNIMQSISTYPSPSQLNNNDENINIDNPSCLDIVNDSIGMGTIDVSSSACGGGGCGGGGKGNPKSYKKQLSSNLSKPKYQSEMNGACSNLVNSIVGAGIIGIPYALKESGLVSGILLLLTVSYFTDKSLRMLVELAHFHPLLQRYNLEILTFEDLMYLPFGTNGTYFVLVSMFLLAYGAMLGYLLVIKDTVPVVLGIATNEEAGTGSFMEREFVMILTSLIIIVPLSMQRDMSSLAYTSLLSVLADVILVGIIVKYSPIEESVVDAGGIVTVFTDNIFNLIGFFVGFGVMTSAMTCQHSAFIVSGSLYNLNSTRWSTVTFRSLSIACILTLILGVCGYLGFLDDTKGDVLNNFQPDTIHANIARFLLAITMVFTYPMEAFVARHVLMKLLFDGDMDGYTQSTVILPTSLDLGMGDFSLSSNDESYFASFFNKYFDRRTTWTFGIFIATLIPAMIVDDLGPVLSISGAIGGSCLAYIGPGLVYLGVNGEYFLQYVRGKLQGVDAHATAVSNMMITTNNGTATTDRTWLDGPKPWWWYPLGMPIWIHIATLGADGMNERLTALQQEHEMMTDEGDVDHHHHQQQQQPTIESIPPIERDYYISITFITVGVIAAVAGVFANFYEQVF